MNLSCRQKLSFLPPPSFLGGRIIATLKRNCLNRGPPPIPAYTFSPSGIGEKNLPFLPSPFFFLKAFSCPHPLLPLPLILGNTHADGGFSTLPRGRVRSLVMEGKGGGRERGRVFHNANKVCLLLLFLLPSCQPRSLHLLLSEWLAKEHWIHKRYHNLNNFFYFLLGKVRL